MVPHDPIGHCPLFQDLEEEDRAYALAYFQATEKSYDKGAFLHHVSFPLSRFGLVLAGTVEVSMDDMDGRHLIMNRVGPGELFGEAYCFLGIDAPIAIQAIAPAQILWLSPDLGRPNPGHEPAGTDPGPQHPAGQGHHLSLPVRRRPGGYLYHPL